MMKKIAALVLALCMLTICFGAFAAGSNSTMRILGGSIAPDNTTTLNVFIPVTTPVSADELDVQVDGTPVTITQLTGVPTTWVVLLDSYSEWGPERLDHMKDVALEIISKNMGSADNGLVLTGGSAWKNSKDLQLGNIGTVKEAIKAFDGKKSGVTPNVPALHFLTDMWAVEYINPRVCLVVISDGATVAKSSWDSVQEKLTRTDAALYGIALVKNNEKHKTDALRTVAESSQGGSFYRYDKSVKTEDAQSFCINTAANIVTAEACQMRQLSIPGTVFTAVPSRYTIALKNSNPPLDAEYVLTENDKKGYRIGEPAEGEEATENAGGVIGANVPEAEDPWYTKTEYLVVAGLALVLVILLIVLVVSGKKKKAKAAAAAAAAAAEKAKQEQAAATEVNAPSAFVADDDGGATEVLTPPAGARPTCRLQLAQENSSNVYTAEFAKNLLVGRSCQKADLTVYPEDKKISGLNSEFSFHNGVMTLKDRGSTNGTFLNGSKLTGEVRVNQHDVVKMGTTRFRVTWTVL